jgi:uncharacterized protein YbjT (DUF2867 family)
MTKILVTGATGHTGSGIVPGLLAKGQQVRALVRDPAKAKALKDAGAEIVVGDMDKPETLKEAVSGVDKIYLVAWNGPTGEQQRKNVVAAAARNGKPHVVVGGAMGSDKSRIVQQIDAANQAVKASGLPWTILQPTFFMQNVMAAIPTIAKGAIYWDLGDGKVGMIDVRDIADCAVAVLTGGGHEGQTYDLTGPAAISFHDVAATLSRVLGREVKYTAVPTAAARDSLVSMGYPEWTADGFGELMAEFARNWGNRTTENVRKLAGHPPRSFEQFVTDFKAAFAG